MKKIGLIFLIILLICGAAFFYWRAISTQQASQPADSVEKYLKLNNLNDQLTDKQEAEIMAEFSSVKDALTKSPNYYDGWSSLGSIKKQLKDYYGAEAVWLHMIELNQVDWSPYNNLADLYDNFLNDKQKAEAAYLKAIKYSKNFGINSFIYRNLFEFYLYELNDKDKALAIIEEGISNNPKAGDLYILAALQYLEKGNKQKAVSYYEQALELAPDNQAIRDELNKLK